MGGGPDRDQIQVAVVLLTYQRPKTLLDTLGLVIDQVSGLSAPFSGRIVVIDNDPRASAAPSVADFAHQAATSHGVEVHYVHEPLPGIAAARHRALLACADDDLLAFIDDDEVPAAGWLRLLVSTWQDYGHPAAVAGRVMPRYQVEPPEWITAGGFFVRRSLPTGTPVQAAGAGNLLLDLAQVRELGIDFDVRLGLRGGEDTLFTHQLSAAGGQILWCEEAQAHDLIPASRMTREWVYRRAFSHGSAHGMVQLELAAGRRARILQRGRLAAGGLARMVAGSLRQVVGLLSGRTAMRVRGKALRHRGFGILAAAFGYRHAEYAREGGHED